MELPIVGLSALIAGTAALIGGVVWNYIMRNVR